MEVNKDYREKGAVAKKTLYGNQSCKLLRHLGTSCPVGLETSRRILKVYSVLFESNSNPFSILFNIFGLILVNFRYFWIILDIILRLLAVGLGSMNQVPSRLKIICRSGLNSTVYPC